MDIAPEDRGENVRREICLTLEQMGIQPESSHHEEGHGQNEIDFRFSAPLTAADNAVTFRSVVQAIAVHNGLYADFSPKPLNDQPGSGMHINISVKKDGKADCLPYLISGILEQVYDMTVFLNPLKNSFDRLGANKAPGYITWSSENRSQLIRIPAAEGEYRRVELRSADVACNPYLAFSLLLQAGMNGIEQKLTVPDSADFNLYTAPADVLRRYRRLPQTLEEAMQAAAKSAFIKAQLPNSVIRAYCER